jgi:hypothetical protein
VARALGQRVVAQRREEQQRALVEAAEGAPGPCLTEAIAKALVREGICEQLEQPGVGGYPLAHESTLGLEVGLETAEGIGGDGETVASTADRAPTDPSPFVS